MGNAVREGGSLSQGLNFVEGKEMESKIRESKISKEMEMGS